MRTCLDYVETVIPKDHLCRVVKEVEVVFSLDTEGIEAKYSFLGQRTYHPKLLLSVLFYGYATGVRSSRKIEERCLSDHFYIYLMQCYTPDHRTISDFRKNNLKEIEKYFVDIVRIFSKLGYSHVGKIYIDGTKLKGNASAKRTKDRAGFEKWLSEIEEEIGKLLKECETIDNQEDESCKIEPEEEVLKKKLSDRKYLKRQIEEALKIMKEEEKGEDKSYRQRCQSHEDRGSKDIRPGYNCQAVVTEVGFIMAAETVTDANDRNQLKPMVAQTESNTQEAAKEAAADSGYGSYANYEYLDQKGIDGYVPDDHFQQYKSGEYKRRKTGITIPILNMMEQPIVMCVPKGKRLTYWKTRTNKTESRQWNHKVYKGTECGTCAKRTLCTKSRVRELLIDIREPLLKRMREKLLSEEGRLKYFMRHYIIEPIFGHLKFNVGYRNFLLRGYRKSKCGV